MYKTILVHCDASRSIEQRLQIAVKLAEQHQAHLIGVFARPPFEAPMAAESPYAMGIVVEEHEKAVAAAEKSAAMAFSKAMKGREISSEWRTADGRAGEVVSLHARYADLTVLGQTDPDATNALPGDLPEDVALATGRAILVVPYVQCKSPPGSNVLLCWNASREAARAASDALPLIKTANSVTVLIVEPKLSAKGHGPVPGAEVATWLARHGVVVNVQVEVLAGNDVAGVILSRAMDLGCDLIVMGIYGHSRLREMVLGGASREVLSSMTVPVLMAH